MLAMYSLNEEERRQRAVMREVLPNAAMWRKWEKTEAPLRQGRGWYPTLDRHFLELLVISEIATLSHPLGGSTDGIGESSPDKIHRHAVKVRRVACERIGQERLGAYCDRVREAFEAYVSSGGWWVEDEDEEEGESPVSAGDVQEQQQQGEEGNVAEEDGDVREETGRDDPDADSAWTDVSFVTHTRDNHGEAKEGGMDMGMDMDDNHHLGRAERDKVDEQVKKLIQGLEAQANARTQGQKQIQNQNHANIKSEGEVVQQTYAQAASSHTGPAYDHTESKANEAEDVGRESRGRRMSRDGNSRSPSPSHSRSPSHSPVKTAQKGTPAPVTPTGTSHKAPPGLIPVSVVSAPTVTIHSPPLKNTVKCSATTGAGMREDEDMVDINLDKSRSAAASASASAASRMLDVHVDQHRDGVDNKTDVGMDLDVELDMAMDAEIAAMRAEALNQVRGHMQGQGEPDGQVKVLGKGLRVELDVLDEDEDELMR